ncbi:MAG: fibronectin type III domain-containing protein [Cyclobacteriaceae bacterium]|nr:fibronectin type III domain-containing protein [Cyclobacteriaceae bacterium]
MSTWSGWATFTTALTPCAIPTGLISSNITHNTATLSWNTVPTAQSYDLEYNDGTTTTPLTVTTLTTNLSSLTANTTYQWRIRTDCSADDSHMSIWSGWATFTTNVEICNMPTGLTSSNIMYNSASLNWVQSIGAKSYDIEYTDGVNLISLNVSTPTANITSLTGSTLYEWRIRANCSLDNSFASEWTAWDTFTTPIQPCDTPTGLVTNNITHNSATLSWNTVPTAQTYDLEYNDGTTTTPLTVNTLTTNLSSLTANTAYQWRVRTDCSIDGSHVSTWSSWELFTTPVEQVEFQMISLYNSSTNALEITVNIPGSYVFSLIDLKGRQVHAAIFDGESYVLQTQDIASSIYIVILEGNGHLARQRISIMR